MSKFDFDTQFYTNVIFNKKKYPKLCQALEKLGYIEQDYSLESNKHNYGIPKANVGYLEDVYFNVYVTAYAPGDLESLYVDEIYSAKATMFDDLDITKYLPKKELLESIENFSSNFYNDLNVDEPNFPVNDEIILK